jgi:hypothetical protein
MFMRASAALVGLLFLSLFLVGCGGDPAFIYSITPGKMTAIKQTELHSALTSLAHRYNLRAISLATNDEPDVIGFFGVPCENCTEASGGNRDYKLSLAYVPSRNIIVIQLRYGPDEQASTKIFRNAVEAELIRVLGPDGFTLEKASGAASIAS